MRYQQRGGLRLAAVGAVLWAMGIGMVTEVHAQTRIFSYAAKFVCGTRLNDTGAVVSGVYATTVNIHNPHFTSVEFRKKAVIALPQSSSPGAISAFVNEALKSDEAVGVNCQDIAALFLPGSPGVFYEGFVVLHSPVALDVVAVYTARHRTGTNTNDPAQYTAESMDVEEVTPKRIPLP